MTDIQIFNNEDFGEIRTAGTSENPLFCLADVCRALELCVGNVVTRLKNDPFTAGVISQHPVIDKLGRTQQANFVNEDGLYDVILDSRKPEAKKFRKWITSEVLPSIRKHGFYELNTKNIKPSDIIGEIGNTRDNIAAVFNVQSGIALAHATDVVGRFYKQDLSSLKNLIPSAEHDTGYLNPTQIGKRLGCIPEKVVNKILMKKGFQYKDGDNWRLTDSGKNYAEETPYTRNNHSGYQIRWNEKVLSVMEE